MAPDPVRSPLRPALDAFWARLNVLNGMFFFFECHLNNFRTMFKEALAARSFPLENLWGGAALAVRDLTEWPAHGWAVYYATGGHRRTAGGQAGLIRPHRVRGRSSSFG